MFWKSCARFARNHLENVTRNSKGGHRYTLNVYKLQKLVYLRLLQQMNVILIMPKSVWTPIRQNSLWMLWHTNSVCLLQAMSSLRSLSWHPDPVHWKETKISVRSSTGFVLACCALSGQNSSSGRESDQVFWTVAGRFMITYRQPHRAYTPPIRLSWHLIQFGTGLGEQRSVWIESAFHEWFSS